MAGLPWLRIYTDLPRDPRSLVLGRLLGDERAWTYVVAWRLWMAEHAPTGSVEGAHADVMLEVAAGWRGTPGTLASAARDAGFLRAGPAGGLDDVEWVAGAVRRYVSAGRLPPIEDADPEPIPVPRFQIRLKTPEERAQAESERARLVEANRQRGERERSHREAMKAAKRAAARVYLIQQDGGDGLVKIGTTTRPVEVRLKELQAGQPHPLVILAHAPGGRYEEGRLHDRFGPHCVTGEWFRPVAELLAYAANVGKAGVL